jgi:hypothetical protein
LLSNFKEIKILTRNFPQAARNLRSKNRISGISKKNGISGISMNFSNLDKKGIFRSQEIEYQPFAFISVFLYYEELILYI